jgi:glycerol uptake facilitator-like aquaporin
MKLLQFIIYSIIGIIIGSFALNLHVKSNNHVNKIDNELETKQEALRNKEQNGETLTTDEAKILAEDPLNRSELVFGAVIGSFTLILSMICFGLSFYYGNQYNYDEDISSTVNILGYVLVLFEALTHIAIYAMYYNSDYNLEEESTNSGMVAVSAVFLTYTVIMTILDIFIAKGLLDN